MNSRVENKFFDCGMFEKDFLIKGLVICWLNIRNEVVLKKKLNASENMLLKIENSEVKLIKEMRIEDRR